MILYYITRYKDILSQGIKSEGDTGEWRKVLIPGIGLIIKPVTIAFALTNFGFTDIPL